jgi:hypothetical protein
MIVESRPIYCSVEEAHFSRERISMHLILSPTGMSAGFLAYLSR